jgi:hypothetical protein
MGDDLAAGVQNLDEKSKFNRNLDFNSHSSTKISTLIVIVQPKSQHSLTVKVEISVAL